MGRIFIFFILVIYVAGCSPKLARTSTIEDYSEDVSAFRPKLEDTSLDNGNGTDIASEKEPYVPPTHDINAEMSVLMDSIIVHNMEKVYYTYTIQVYIGRSREEANQIREKVYRILPQEKPELNWRQPSWLVTVGKYHDRVDAYKTLTRLRKTFPGAGMVRERNTME